MKPLLPKCYVGYRFGKINVNNDYFLCCGTPAIGNYNEDGRFKDFWKSKKYQNIRNSIKYDLEGQNKEWDDDCRECPHYSVEKSIIENLDGSNDSVNDILTEDRKNGMLKDIPLVGPREFQFEVGNPCNHRCNFCWNWSYKMLEDGEEWNGWKEWSKQSFDLDMYTSIIDDLEELGGCEVISISGGGEPFIIKDIMKMIEHTKKADFFLKIFTNFSRVNRNDMDNFIKWGVDRFEVNISAGTMETYCKIRKLKPKSWDILIDNLIYLNDNKITENPKIKYVVIVTNENIHEVDEIFETAIKVGSYFIDFRDLVSHGVYNGEDLLPTKEQVDIFNEKFFENMKRYGFERETDDVYYSKDLGMGVFNESLSYRG